MFIKYGYDKFYQRGYFIRDDVKNITANRMYIWKTYDGWQLYRFYNFQGVARNIPLLDKGVKKNTLRQAAAGVKNMAIVG